MRYHKAGDPCGIVKTARDVTAMEIFCEKAGGKAVARTDRRCHVDFFGASEISRHGITVKSISTGISERYYYTFEIFAAATTNYKKDVLFTINYRKDLTTAHVVRYRGVLYDITRIDTFEGYKEDLTLYCSRRARQK